MKAPDILLSVTALGERPSVERQVATALRDLIGSGRLPEGTSLRHRELAERLGVSPMPVRVVLGMLQREGLGEIGRTGRGREPPHAGGPRGGLRGTLGSRGASRATQGQAVNDEDVARIHALLARLRALADEKGG